MVGRREELGAPGIIFGERVGMGLERESWLADIVREEGKSGRLAAPDALPSGRAIPLPIPSELRASKSWGARMRRRRTFPPPLAWPIRTRIGVKLMVFASTSTSD